MVIRRFNLKSLFKVEIGVKLLNLHKKLKIKKAIDAMKNMAALHEPDMFAGGYFDYKPTCMGDASVNSSIGVILAK